MSRRLVRMVEAVGVALFVVLFLGQFRMYRAATLPNERSRLYLTYALVEQGKLSIDEPVRRFGRVMDEARYKGHAYTDKAPGSSLLAVIPYALLRGFVSKEDVTAETLLGVGRWGVLMPVTVLGIWAFRQLGRRLGIDEPTTRVACLGWLSATAALHYSAAFFGHHIVAVLLLGVALLVGTETRGPPRLGRLALAGALLGLGLLVEYQAVVGCAVWCLVLLARPHRGRLLGLGFFVLGMLPLLIVLLEYHRRCFGGPFELGYHHLSHPGLAAVHSHGIGGVLLPTGEGLYGTLLSLHRGLFTTSPFLLFAPLGLCALRREHRAVVLSMALLSVGFVVFMASSRTWEAGWGYGPRLLVPVLPLMVLLSARAVVTQHRLVWLPSLWRGGIVAGMLGYGAMVVSLPEPPVEMTNPVVDVALVLLRRGAIAPSLTTDLLGWPNLAGLLVFAVLWLGVVSFVGRRSSPQEPPRRWAVGLLVLPLCTAGLLVLGGPSVSTAAQKSLVTLIERWQRVEVTHAR